MRVPKVFGEGSGVVRVWCGEISPVPQHTAISLFSVEMALQSGAGQSMDQTATLH